MFVLLSKQISNTLEVDTNCCFQFNVRATDDGIPARSNDVTAMIIINVNKNEFDPVFNSLSLNFKQIDESLPVGSSVALVS